MQRFPRRYIVMAICGLGVLACAAMLSAGFFGSRHPAFDSFSHLRVHVAALMGLVAIPLLFTQWFKAGIVAILFAGLTVSTTIANAPVPGLGMQYGRLTIPAADAPIYRLMQLNLRYDNKDMAEMLSLVGRVKPDVITLNEASQAWQDRLQALFAAYPFHMFCRPSSAVWGVAILSRRPLAEGFEPHCASRGDFGIARFDFNGRTLEVASMHLGWPWPFEQAWNIDYLTPYLSDIGETALLAGDLNAVPWSFTVKTIASIAGMTLMPSVGPTWLQFGFPRGMIDIGLPIDQVFAKGSVAVHAITRLEDVASDHRPILVEFSVTAPSSRPGAGATMTVGTRIAASAG